MAKPVPRIGSRRNGRRIPKGVIHVQASFNNTIVTVTDVWGWVISWSSAGTCGFKGAPKFTYSNVQQGKDRYRLIQFVGSRLQQMLTGHAQITRLQTTVFPTWVVTPRPGSKVRTTSLDNLTNIIDTKEWVAPESNKTKTSNPSIGVVPDTTSDPPSGSPGTSE